MTAPKEKIDKNTMILTSLEFGALVGFSDRYVRDLGAEGILEKTKAGKYELGKNVRRLMAHIQAKNSINAPADAAKGVSSKMDTEKMLKMKAQRERAELELAVMKGELHKADDVMMVMTDMITNAKTKLLGLPSKMAPMLIEQSSRTKVQALLSAQIEEALMELVDYKPEMFSNSDMVSTGEEEGADEEDDCI